MKRIAQLLLFLLAVPAAGLIISGVIRTQLDEQLRAFARSQLPNAAPDAFDRWTVKDLCQQVGDRRPDLCPRERRLTILRTSSIAVGLAGLAWVAAIALAGATARRDRQLLLVVFKPGLYLTGAVVVALIAAHGALLVGTLAVVRSTLAGFSQVQFILFVSIGAIAGIVTVVRHVFNVMSSAEAGMVVGGRPVSREEAPRLWGLVDAVAARLDALRPEHIVIDIEPSFFVTEADVVTPSARLTGRTLVCSLSLARLLTTREFESIVGHELAHFSGADTQFSERFYPIYRGSTNSLNILQARRSGGGVLMLTLLPAIALLQQFLDAFETAERTLARQRELAADEAGARVTDRQAIASALVKVHAFEPVWARVEPSVLADLEQGRPVANIGETYAALVLAAARPDVLARATAETMSHPTNSHPPLSDRLEALGVSLASIQKAALRITPADPASALMDDVDRLERELSHDWQALLAEEMGFAVDGTPPPQGSDARAASGGGGRLD